MNNLSAIIKIIVLILVIVALIIPSVVESRAVITTCTPCGCLYYDANAGQMVAPQCPQGVEVWVLAAKWVRHVPVRHRCGCPDVLACPRLPPCDGCNPIPCAEDY